MEIEILHIAECPNVEEAVRRTEAALDELGVGGGPVRRTLISTPEEAARVPFAGSPTMLIDGVDAFASDGATGDPACRVYRSDGRLAGFPSEAEIRAVIEERFRSSAGAVSVVS